MPINIDTAFGVHEAALALRARRAEILAANLANADTPNYKARDIDFNSVLAQVQDAGQDTALAATDAAHVGFGTDNPLRGVLQYRVPLQSAIDGNTVDTQIEQAEFARNALQYEASLTFMSARIKTLLTAIRGE